MSRRTSRKDHCLVGVISDTHGLTRPEALAALAGVDLIIHAGDVGSPRVLEELSAIAPVTVVRGNNDTDVWARSIPETEAVAGAGAKLFVLHALQELDFDPAAAGFDAVISGHSHRPSIREHEGVLYLNPGSAGPRRFKLPLSVALVEVQGKTCRARILELEANATPSRARRKPKGTK